MPSPPDITQLLIAWSNGDQAALDALAPLVHRELHRRAQRHMAGERPGHILHATALVNEAFMRLVDWKDVRWQNRAHSFAVASRIMRHILVDFARAGGRAKRGKRQLQVSLSDAADVPIARSADLVALDDRSTTGFGRDRSARLESGACLAPSRTGAHALSCDAPLEMRVSSSRVSERDCVRRDRRIASHPANPRSVHEHIVRARISFANAWAPRALEERRPGTAT